MEEEINISEQPANRKVSWKRFLSHQWVVKNIPFFLFLAVLAVLYIYNGHYEDKMTRKIGATEKHIKELEYEYKTIKSEVILKSKASQLAGAVEHLGLKELTVAPILLDSLVATP